MPVQLTLDFKANPDVAISGNSRPGNRAQSQRVIPRLSRRNTLPSTPATIFVLDHRDTDLMVRKYKFAKGGPNTEDSFARFQQNLLRKSLMRVLEAFFNTLKASLEQLERQLAVMTP